jgi:hypothetical protein
VLPDQVLLLLLLRRLLCLSLSAEALRIHPPLLMVMRYAKQPFTVTTSKGQAYTIPAVSRHTAPVVANIIWTLVTLVPAMRAPPMIAMHSTTW